MTLFVSLTGPCYSREDYLVGEMGIWEDVMTSEKVSSASIAHKKTGRIVILVAVFLMVGITGSYVFLLRWRVEFCSQCAVVRKIYYFDLLPGKRGNLTVYVGRAISNNDSTPGDILSKYSPETSCSHDWQLIPGPSVTSLSRRLRRLWHRRLVGTSFKDEFLYGAHCSHCIERIAQHDSDLAFAIVQRILAASTEADVKREYTSLLEVDVDIDAGHKIDYWRSAYGLPVVSPNSSEDME